MKVASILIIAICLLVNIIAFRDAWLRYRRGSQSGKANGSIIYFRALRLSKGCLVIAQCTLLAIVIISHPVTHIIPILRAMMSMMMAATAWVNMRSFHRLRDGH
jgi:hypothetical protein